MRTLDRTKFHLIRFLRHFAAIVKQFRPFVESFAAGLSNLRATCRQRQFEEKLFLKKLSFSSHFWILSKNFSPCDRSFSTELKELLFTCLLKSTEEKIKTYIFPIIFVHEQNFFGFCQKHFWQDRQNFF